MMLYERFEAWKLCHKLNIELCRVSQGWGKKGFNKLMWQTQSAAWSAPANIVEGSTKKGPREFRPFLDISLGSLAEIAYALRVAKDLNLLFGKDLDQIESLREAASKTTWFLYKSVRRAAEQM
jgi:four helix bundle protein